MTHSIASCWTGPAEPERPVRLGLAQRLMLGYTLPRAERAQINVFLRALRNSSCALLQCCLQCYSVACKISLSEMYSRAH